MLWGELIFGDGVGEGLFVGAFLCGWLGWCLGHLVVRLSWGFRFLQFCADGGEDVLEGGGGGGVWCRIVPGNMVPRWVPGVLLNGDGGSGVVFRRPSVQIVVEGAKGDGVAVFPAVDCKEDVEAVPGVPRREGVGCGCRFQEGVHGIFLGVLLEKVVLRAPLSLAPFLLPPPLQGRVGRWELSVDGLVVLLGVHGVGQGAGQCGVDVVWGGGGRRGRGGAVGFLSLVFRVLVRGGCRGYGAGCMEWLGSCGFVACWRTCERGAVAGSRSRMVWKTS